VKAFHETINALPDALTYRGEVLDFEPDDHDDRPGFRQTRSARYAIYLVTQLTRFMIYHHYVFADTIEGSISLPVCKSQFLGRPASSAEASTAGGSALQSCPQAGDNVLHILRHCSDDHIRYVNPFLASTTWLAAALRIFRKVFIPDDSRELTESKYERLDQTYLQFAQFWETPLTLLDNLDSLEERVNQRQKMLTLSTDRKTGAMAGRRSFSYNHNPSGKVQLEMQRRGSVQTSPPRRVIKAYSNMRLPGESPEALTTTQMTPMLRDQTGHFRP